jgi:hypothetical protein
VLIGGIVLAVVLAASAVGLFTRRRSHDDVHSVEHYHRQLHTLEGMNAHPAGSGREIVSESGVQPAYPGSALRLAGSSTVRVVEPVKPAIPPVPPPPVGDGTAPVSFDDAAESPLPLPLPPPPDATGSMWQRDRTMDAINHRPRRLAAPATAVAAVIVIVIVLLITGSHSVAPPHHGKADAAAAHARRPGKVRAHHVATTTSTTLPLVSQPAVASDHEATYSVGLTSFPIVLSATSGPCWVEATDTANGSTLFTGVLEPGQQHTVDATGSLSVIAGAPAAFAATIDGAAVTLPSGYQAPFTLQFVPTT